MYLLKNLRFKFNKDLCLWVFGFLPRSCAEQTYVLKQFINQIMAAKRQIITRGQLEKMDSEQLVQSFLLLQDEILGGQTELLQQSNIINERLGDLSKKFQDLLNENNIIKSRLAVAENASSLLKSNTKKLNKQLI